MERLGARVPNSDGFPRRMESVRIKVSLLCLLFFAILFFPIASQASGGGELSARWQDSLSPVSAKFMPEVSLTDETRDVNVDQFIRYLEDAHHQFNVKDVHALPNEFLHANPVGPFNFGYSDSAIWIKIPLRYKGRQAKANFLLELDVPLLDQAEMFVVREGKRIDEVLLDYDKAMSEREVPYPSMVFPFALEKGERAILYLRVSSDFSIHIPLRIYSPIGFSQHVSLVDFFHGLFNGGLMIMIAYNFFVFLSVREKAYFYYVLYITIYLIFMATERVHGLQVFGDIPAMFHKKYLAMYIWGSWIGAFCMGRHFLNSEKNLKTLDKVLKLAIQAAFISIFISFFAERSIAIQWAVFGTLVCTCLVCYFAYAAMSRNLPGAKLYFLAWLLNFGGVAVYALTVTGNMPFNVLTANSPQIGIICQLIFISFALADRIKVAQNQALDANELAVRHLQRYQSLFDNAVEGVFQISLERRFIESNPAMAKLLGYETPKALMDHVPDAIAACFLDESDRQRVIRTIQSGKNLEEMESCYRNRQGELRWAESKIRIIYNRNGKPSHLEGSFVDVTEKKQQDQYEKEREQDRMQRQVAEASAAAKSQFLANMSHEIRTPLTAIIGYGESLLDDSMDEREKRTSAETVVRSGRHLLELINDILDHSKIDANKLEVEVLSVPLLEILSEVRAYFEPKASQKRLEFGIQYDFPLPEKIQTDPTRLKQILINLCGNALKFTERGSISINVRCDRDNEMLFIKVLDTGIGLKPEQMSRLFDPFAQASPSIAREYGGTGLGLNISKKLAEMLGGTIRVSSTYGQGSEFEISLSTGDLRSVGLIRDGSELSESQTQLKIAKAPRLSGRILYAEDNEVNRKLIDLLVRKTGAEITMVVNGAEALKAAADDSYDLILMDIQMPVMDGRDATEAIRKSGNRTPIVALTANIMAEDIREYREAGCDDCLSKPVDKNRFYEVLSRYLTVKAEEPGLDWTEMRFKGRVLVAEDNPDNQMLMTRYLNKFGVEAVVAESGRAAVQKALSGDVSLILMDHHMPEMEGPDAIRMLRQAGYRRPIYSFTASDSKDDLAVLEAAGSDGVLAKPVDRYKLFELLEKFLEPEGEEEIETADEDDELRPIVDQFVRSLPDRMLAMRTHAEDNEWDEVRQIAHQIKGIAGAVGYPRLTAKAKDLDISIKQGDRARYEVHLESVLDESEKIVDSY